jgi:hypothetical protein
VTIQAHDQPKAVSAIVQILFATLTIFLGLFAAVAVNATPRDPGRIAAVFPPWWSPAEAIAAGGSAGDIAGAGGAAFILVLRGDPADLARRARSAGAVLILDPDLAGLCAPGTPEARS